MRPLPDGQNGARRNPFFPLRVLARGSAHGLVHRSARLVPGMASWLAVLGLACWPADSHEHNLRVDLRFRLRDTSSPR